MKTVLSTKTLSDDDIATGRSLNIDIQCRDFTEIEAIPFDTEVILKNDYDTVVFTSANAVKMIVKNADYIALLKTKNVFAINGRTSDELMKAGINVIAVADNAKQLSAKIMEAKQTKNILHPIGNKGLDTLGTKMKSAGIGYQDLIVYNTNLVDVKLNEDYDAVMFYSPSGVESFYISNKLRAQTLACCIGETTLKFLQKKQANAMAIIPEEPSPASMIKAIADYFNHNSNKA